MGLSSEMEGSRNLYRAHTAPASYFCAITGLAGGPFSLRSGAHHQGLRCRILEAELDSEKEDDGPGIAPAHLQAVTQRGVRLDEETQGSGLELAIVQELVAVYGGELHLANRTEASGLRVKLSLPRHATS